MKKVFKIIISILVVIALTVFFFFITSKKIENVEPSFQVINKTNYKNADTLVYHLSQIFGYDTLKIHLISIPNVLNYYAIVQKLKDHEYVILLNNSLSNENLKLALSHEFIHIRQYETGDLLSFKRHVFYKGDSISIDVKYSERVYEQEAFKEQYEIVKKLNERL